MARTRAAGTSDANSCCQRRTVDGNEARALGDEARHRPVVIKTTIEPRNRELCQIRCRLRVIRNELLTVVIRAIVAQEGRRPCVMQMRVVENGQAGIPEEIGPQIVVM